MADASVDAALDLFCMLHVTEPLHRSRYLQEMARAVKVGGYVLVTLADVSDGFYGPLLAESPDPQRRLVIDPVAGFPTILEDAQTIPTLL